MKLYYGLLILPLIAVYIPSIFFPVDNAGENVRFRPPGYVFAIVWPILLTLVGISWFISYKNGKTTNILYLLLIILLGSWTGFYKYNKIAGLVIIILSFIVTILTILLNYKKLNKYGYRLLIPLALWLGFAISLNIASIKF